MILLAQAQQITDSGANWTMVLGLTQLLTLAMLAFQFVRSASGKGGERQIEPTALADIRAALGDINDSVATMNREMGATSEAVNNLQKLLEESRACQREDINGAHRRIDELSKEVARQGAEIKAIQRGCEKC
jgi:3-keto-L-gulonate-6-phosphate decarboxylase